MMIMPIDPNLNIIRDGLVLWCDGYMQPSYGGSGTTWTDISGFGNHLTHSTGFGSSIVWDSATKSFVYNPESGKTRRVFVTGDEYNVSTIKQCTIEMWVRFDTLARYNGLFAFGNMYGNPSEIQLQSFTHNIPEFYITFAAYGVSGTPIYQATASATGMGKTVNINQWVQIAISWSGNSSPHVTNIYIDGNASVVDISGSEITGNLNLPDTTNRQLNVCSRRATNFGQLDGNCAIVRFYTRALSQAEIQHNFNQQRVRFGI